MEKQSASSGGASEVREVAAARESIAEAKKDVKEAKAEVATAEAKVAAAEAKVAAAEARVKAAQEGTNQEERASATSELRYAQESRQVAFNAWRVAVDALESLGKSRAVREGILNNLLLQQSGAMQSHACTGFRKAMHSLGFCLRCATNLRDM